MKKKIKIIIFVLLVALISICIRSCYNRYNHRRYVAVPKKIFDKYTPEEFRDKRPEVFKQNPELYDRMLNIYEGYLRLETSKQRLLEAQFIEFTLKK